jgi:biopolymer transport protein ExbD
LPQASRSQVDKHKDEIIDLAVNGDISFEGQRVSKDELEDRLRKQPPDTSFLIRADRDLTFQKFVDVADILKRLNFTKVAIQTQNVSK